MNETLTGTTTLCQGGPGSNVYEGELHITKSYTTGTLLVDDLMSYPVLYNYGIIFLY